VNIGEWWYDDASSIRGMPIDLFVAVWPSREENKVVVGVNPAPISVFTFRFPI